jgi:glutaredoxin
VTGTVYSSDDPKAPVVVLYTKEGCTLCDKVKDVLKGLSQDDYPHSLEQIDITDEEHTEWYDMYKYDIPVLHINSAYWTKHRLDETEAKNGLKEGGNFQPRQGQPNAAEMERKQAERENSK